MVTPDKKWSSLGPYLTQKFIQPLSLDLALQGVGVKGRERGREGETERRKKVRKRKETIFCPLSHWVSRDDLFVSILLFVGIGIDPLFLFQKKILLMPLLYLSNSSSLHVVANFLNVSKSALKLTLKNSLCLGSITESNIIFKKKVLVSSFLYSFLL